MIVSVVKA